MNAITPIFPPLDIDAGPESVAALPRRVVLANGTDLKPTLIRWLWLFWLALGKLHILAGAPGQGKTTLALAMAATVTIGGRWPDGGRCEKGSILIWSGEDDPADTLLPRLLAAGADRDKCYFITGTRDDGGIVQPFDPALDLPALQHAIAEIGDVRLVIVDPVVSAVTGDSHKNTEVRRALQPLVDLAAGCGCVVLGITHFAKGGQGTDPAQRVVGSVAFSAVARVVLVAAKVKGDDGQDRRILARSKSNIGPDDGGFEYHLDQAEAMPGIPAARIAWGAPVQGTARELLTDPHDDGQDEHADAGAFLRSLLADGPMLVKDIFKEAGGAGYSPDQMKRASRKLRVEKQKESGRMGGPWRWALRSTEGSAKNAPLSNVLPSLPSHPSAAFPLPSQTPETEEV